MYLDKLLVVVVGGGVLIRSNNAAERVRNQEMTDNSSAFPLSRLLVLEFCKIINF